jgi:hypothetical protein
MNCVVLLLTKRAMVNSRSAVARRAIYNGVVKLTKLAYHQKLKLGKSHCIIFHITGLYVEVFLFTVFEFHQGSESSHV